MKKFTWFFILLCAIGCNNPEKTKPNEGKTDSTVGNNTDTAKVYSEEELQNMVFGDLFRIPNDVANEMKTHARGASCKTKNGATTSFSKADIGALMAVLPVKGFRLVLACFLNNETDTGKKNMATLLLEVEVGDPGSAIAGTTYYYSSRKICPPPDNVCL